jgi:hypothetical protein
MRNHVFPRTDEGRNDVFATGKKPVVSMEIGLAISSLCPSASSLYIVASVRRTPVATELGCPSRLSASSS